MLEQTVPRYTSYPTAPHFSAAIGSESYRSWLSARPKEATLSLYLHVPFCTQLCFYCRCHTKAVLRRDPTDAYARRLIEEIGLVGRHAGGRKVVHLHWGGGTPSILGADWLRARRDRRRSRELRRAGFQPRCSAGHRAPAAVLDSQSCFFDAARGRHRSDQS